LVGKFVGIFSEFEMLIGGSRCVEISVFIRDVSNNSDVLSLDYSFKSGWRVIRVSMYS